MYWKLRKIISAAYFDLHCHFISEEWEENSLVGQMLMVNFEESNPEYWLFRKMSFSTELDGM